MASGSPALDPDIAAHLARAGDAGREPVSFVERRLQFAAGIAAIDAHGPAMRSEEPVSIAGDAGILPARLFRPESRMPQAPLMLFFHGGGWIQGSVETHASICRYLAHHVGVDVLSVEYRLAPEHPFPAPLDDAIAALRWSYRNAAMLGAGDGIILAGDSAGGNLAAGACLRAMEMALPSPRALLLLYPALDLAGRTRSRDTFRRGYWLDTLDELIALYAPVAGLRENPGASPLRAASLAGFPPTAIVTAGHDPLRDEGIMFAQRLIVDDVRTMLISESSMIHGFCSLHGIFPGCLNAFERAATGFRHFLSS